MQIPQLRASRCARNDRRGGVSRCARNDAGREQPLQRLKHLVGPGTKLLSADDHTSVDTSTCSGDSRMLFTDDGRPPRMRLDTVPAVEITVPFFVCSM